ncbi:neuraminidase-like domain-containing protein [Sorangium sp. So ce1000]|uniref:Tc toxin subunit A-related protein n=1 Tax=Sorangium sp. So ce1000 TaxID=3133325 RepID=UPI003F5F9054
MRFVVQGTVRGRGDDRGVAGLRIEAWDASGACDSLLGYAQSDADGGFAMHISEDDLRPLLGPRVATAYFRVVLLPDRVLLDTRGSLEWRLDKVLTEVILRVVPDKPIAGIQQLTPFIVRGAVFGADGPNANLFVKAYDQGPTSQEELTPTIAKTDARGNYQLTYEPPASRGKQRADLVVKAFRDAQCTVLAGESAVRCQAPPTVVVNVTLTHQTWFGPSRYTRVDRALSAVLAQTSPSRIPEERKEHIACSAGIDRADLDALIAADGLSSVHKPLSRSLAFALILRGFPADADGFFLHAKSAITAELRAALAANMVPQTLRTNFALAIEEWVQAAKAWSLLPRAGRAGLRELLVAAGVPPVDHETFAEQFLRNEGDIATFWSTLSSTFDKPRIQLALQWGAFTHGHTPLLSWWKGQYDGRRLRTLAEACEMTEADWLAVLDSGSPAIGAPSDIPGASEKEKRQNFAKVLVRTLATALPMVAYRKRVAVSVEQDPVRHFFDRAHPTFDFTKDRLSKKPFSTTLAGMDVAHRNRLKGMERLFRVVPRYEEIRSLLDAGYFSVHQIHAKGRAQFVSEMAAALGGAEAAETVYSQACYTVASAKVLFGKYGLATHLLRMRSIPDYLHPSSSAANQIPDWTTLFGSAGGCACAHCKSVLGPAAYFVDLMHWLSEFRVLDKLLVRRPDLVKIKLTCKSSHTPLPYLDLVNEALEVRVANEFLTPDPTLSPLIETTYEPDELLAGPEIVHQAHHLGAWKAVAAAVHPFTLPRDLWAEEAGVYLDWLGTSREEIFRTLSKSTGSAFGVEIARARLSVRDDTPNAGWRLILGTQAANTRVLWGNLPNHVAELSKVPRFIAMAGLNDFEELTALLATRYVNGPDGTGAAGLPALSLSPANGCDIAAMILGSLSEPHLARIHRFIRLARLTGLSLGDLDTLAAAFSADASNIALSADVVSKVAAALSLAQRLNLTAPEIAALYAPLDTHERHRPVSAYRRLFLNKMVDAPDVSDFLTLLTAEPDEQGAKTYAEHRASLAQALVIRPEDLDLLFDAATLEAKLNLPASERLVDATARIARTGVSRLYRAVRLARALRMRVPDFLVLRALLGSDPFVSPVETEAFLASIDDVHAQGLGPDRIQFVLRAFATEASGLTVEAEELAAVRTQVAMAVDGLHAQTNQLEDPVGDRAKALLRELLPTNAGSIFGVLEGRETASDPPWRALLSPLQPYTNEDFEKLQDLLAGPATKRPQLASPAERFAVVTRLLERHLRGLRVVVESLAAWAKIEVSAAAYLLGDVLRSRADDARPATYDFLHPDNKLPELRDATLVLLRRHALLLQGTRIGAPIPPADPLSGAPDTPGELTTFGLYASGSPLRSLLEAADPVDLPTVKAHFARYLDVARHTALRDRLAGGPDALRTFLEATGNTEALRKILAEQTGWDAPTVEHLAGAHYGFTAAQLKDIANLRTLERGVKLVARVGLTASELSAYLVLDPPLPSDLATPNTPPNARDLAVIARRAAKAKVSAETWATLARTLRDKVRGRVRRALIDWLVPRTHADISALFADLLLDPEMGDCLLSSRIVAATNTVQLFVQRCLLNLEPGSVLDEDASNVWQWMKTYRLWEANRKVFLYPENYLEPDLRDDKTPLYKRLETRLRQGEITDQTAEKAFEEYLFGLHEIAKLEVMGVATASAGFDEEDQIPYYDEHVVARTRSKPYKWFYRRRMREQRWTPWERMDLDIEADAIHLRWENRRLYLFWPVFVRKPLEDQKGASPDSDEQAQSTERYEVRIAWSAYEGGVWVPTRHSTSPPLNLIPAKSETTSDPGITTAMVSIVPDPQVLSRRLRIFGTLRLLVVVRILSGVVTRPVANEIFAYLKAGIFAFDPCGGGSWRTYPLEDDIRAVDPRENPDKWYGPNCPAAGSLLASRIREDPISDTNEFRISRELYDRAGLTAVPLLGSHQGEWIVATPARGEKPHLEMNHFSFEDANRVFYASFHRTISVTWHEASRAYPGMYAGLEPANGKRAGKGALETWADQATVRIAHEWADERYRFELFEHPYVCEFTRRLAADGLPGLLGWKKDHNASVQFRSQELEAAYAPTRFVESSFPRLEVDFSPRGAYSDYNWELFFHVPFAIAKALHKEGRYAEAQKWLHYIFDPTSDTETGGSGDKGPRRYWKVKPFYENTDLSTIQDDLEDLAIASASAAEIQAIVAGDVALQENKEDLEMQIAESIADPFNPHALARHRGLAYQKSVVLFYLDLLLDWGDSLFRSGSMETIHEALQLYLLAVDLLGPRPTFVEHKAEAGGLTYEQLKADLDKSSNAAVTAETVASNVVPWGWRCSSARPMIPDFRLYFCIPGNDKLLGLWDRVADRLFKLRNCLDIEGVARQIPLFEPPIDPALLVRARAAGVRFDQVLQALAAPAPMYRFARLHAKAVEFASAVLDLGRALLGAIEKKDSEALAALRQGHDVALAEAEREVRKNAIQEAQATLAGLLDAQAAAVRRFNHYDILITTDPIPEEEDQVAHLETARTLHFIAGATESVASVLALVPDATVGGSGMCCSPVAKLRFGGSNLSNAARAVAAGVRTAAADFDAQASLSGITASWARRKQEWTLQKDLANLDIAQFGKQILAQQIRLSIAQQELNNLDLRLRQSREIESSLRRKFSNVDLYDWMVAELAAEHYQAYQLAFDMAKRAERAYQLERGDTASFIRFGAWDSLKKGLLAGERLLQDLRAMEHAFLTRSDREREIVKNIALSEIDGAALRKLRHGLAEGAGESPPDEVEFLLPEELFDADYPGHYFRRIKSVAVTIPAVKPALDSVQCELVLRRSSVRVSSLLTDGAYARTEPRQEDPRFRDDHAARRHLVTSAGEADSGLFEVNLRDDMLLPFEGAGVDSTWAVRVPRATNRFPLHLLSDVILHIRYTARDGGLALREAALEEAKAKLVSRTRMFSLRRDFPTAWALFLRGNAAGTRNEMEILLAQDHFLPFFGEPATEIQKVMLSGTFTQRAQTDGKNGNVPMQLCRPGEELSAGFSSNLAVGAGEPIPTNHPIALSPHVELMRLDMAVPWTLVATPPANGALRGENGLLRPDVFEDLWLTVTYAPKRAS